MATIKSYTDIEQSKKLAEILGTDSADMYRVFENNAETRVYYGKMPTAYFVCKPCWSLAALMNLLPSEFTEVGKYSKTTYKIHIRKYAFTDDVDIYQIAYGNYKFYEDGNSSWKDMINTGEKENLIDAAFDMICWLKENGKI